MPLHRVKDEAEADQYMRKHGKKAILCPTCKDDRWRPFEPLDGAYECLGCGHVWDIIALVRWNKENAHKFATPWRIRWCWWAIRREAFMTGPLLMPFTRRWWKTLARDWWWHWTGPVFRLLVKTGWWHVEEGCVYSSGRPALPWKNPHVAQLRIQARRAWRQGEIK